MSASSCDGPSARAADAKKPALESGSSAGFVRPVASAAERPPYDAQ
ncbi:hypothetical protein BURMUCGD2M_4854 [Burkholderia multivorans CGD2M]|nr:hypothetical protein BURMUCGD2M_4854 [Burkholderia multivorans CGD2M]